MLNPLCSIIVAAYNEENNIRQCLDCLVNQTYENIEVIIVDDGSTDNTASIVRKYLEKHENVKYIFQENAGAAAARKIGVLATKSDFFTFLDCDDEFPLDSIEKAIKEFDNETDIVLFELNESLDETNTNYKKFEYFINDKIINGGDAFRSCIESWGLHGLGIYRKSVFLKANEKYHTLNDKNYINNDEIITKLCFLYSNKIKISNAVYFYKYNLNSTTKRININYFLTLENSLIFKKICDKENIYFNYSNLLFKETRYIFKRFKKWYPHLKNKLLWIDVMKKCLKFIATNGLNELDLKHRVKLYRMYIYLCIVGWYEK